MTLAAARWWSDVRAGVHSGLVDAENSPRRWLAFQLPQSLGERGVVDGVDVAPRGLQGVEPAGLDSEHRGLRLQFADAVGRGELVQVVDELVRALQSVCHGVAGLGGRS